MTFTGPDLYRAFNAGDEDAVPWSAVSRDIQDLHVCAAAIVQQQHIAPLQELIAALRDRNRYLKAFDEAVFEEDKKKIEALQQLVHDQQAWIDDIIFPLGDPLDVPDPRGLTRVEFRERASKLLGEEVK